MTYTDAINVAFDSLTKEVYSILSALKKQLEVLESLNIQERLDRVQQEAEQTSDLAEKLKIIGELSEEKEFIIGKIAQAGLFKPFETIKPPVVNTLHDDTEEQIKKVKRRVPSWIHRYFAGLEPCNGTILVRFLELSEENTRPIRRYELENACKDVSNFVTNYHNMRNMLPANHGKVFEESYGNITLWEPVAEFVLDIYEKIKI